MQHWFLRARILIVGSILLSTMAACGGGGGGGGGGAAQSHPLEGTWSGPWTAVDEPVTGTIRLTIYSDGVVEGEITVDGNPDKAQVAGDISDSGELVATANEEESLTGTLDMSGEGAFLNGPLLIGPAFGVLAFMSRQ